MAKFDISKLLKTATNTLVKHGPEILTGLGVAGMIGCTILAVKATPKALKLIEEEKEKKGVEKLTPVETVKAAWKPYTPAVALGTASVACIIGASATNYRRNAALTAAYKLSETAFTEYREKVVETIGEEKEKEVKSKIAKDLVEKNPVSKNTVVVTGSGNTLCLDETSGRYFYSDKNYIEKIQNTLNQRMLFDICGYVSLNEFYDELDIDHLDIGDKIGWNTAHMIDIHIDGGISDDGRPCLVIMHNNPPKYEFDKFM
jgi:hypothetical protein